MIDQYWSTWLDHQIQAVAFVIDTPHDDGIKQQTCFGQLHFDIDIPASVVQRLSHLDCWSAWASLVSNNPEA